MTYDDDREIGDLSDVIELDNGYVISKISDIKFEGTKKKLLELKILFVRKLLIIKNPNIFLS